MEPSSSHHSVRVKPPKLTPGGALRVYFHQLDDYFRASSITDDDLRITIFRTGLSLPDYKVYVINSSNPTEYESMRDNLLKVFDAEDPPHQRVGDFMSATQTRSEGVAAFLERLKITCRRAYPQLDNAAREILILSQLKRGLLSPRIREEALISEEKCPTTLAEKLARIEDAMKDYSPIPKVCA